MIWMDSLSPERRRLALEYFETSPAMWPPGMREGVDTIARQRRPRCSEDVIEIIAEYMVLNPEVAQAMLRAADQR